MSEFERSYTRTTCRFCGGGELLKYLDLGDQPPSNAFITAAELAAERRYPLRAVLCSHCGASQLSHVVAAKSIYSDYAYLSSTSRPLVEYYQSLVDKLVARFQPAASAVMVDIGANDGIMLRRYPSGQFRLVGVEPSSAGEEAVKHGLDIRRRFFDAEAVAGIVSDPGAASIVTATNVFAHVDEIGTFSANLRDLLAPDGVFVIEFPYIVDTVDNLYFDTIYHEHLSYLGLTPLVHLTERSGLRVFDVERTPTGASGPALRVFVCRAEAGHAKSTAVDTMLESERLWGIAEPAIYQRFAERVERVRGRLKNLIAEIRADGGRVGGYTAPAKGNTLLNYLGVTVADIESIAETNRQKIGTLTPGTHIPVVDEDEFLRSGITHALLLSWNYANFFREHSPFAKAGGRFIIPLPEPSVI